MLGKILHFLTSTPPTPPRWFMAAGRYWGWMTFGIVLLALINQGMVPFNTDNAWLLLLAQRVVEGTYPIYPNAGVETNPPMMIYLNLIPAWLSQQTGWPMVWCFRGFFTAALLIGWGLCVAALRQIPSLHGWQWRMMAVFLAYGLFLLPGMLFGQRDHLLFAWWLPFAVMTFCRIEGISLPRWARLLAGVLTGIATCLKPQAAVFFGIAAVITIVRRCFWSWVLSVESLAAVGTGILFCVVVWAQEPYFMNTLLPILHTIYATFTAFDFENLKNVSLILPGVLLSVLLVTKRYNLPIRQRRFLWGMLLLWGGFFLLAVLQMRSFAYHYTGLFILCLLITGWAYCFSGHRLTGLLTVIFMMFFPMVFNNVKKKKGDIPMWTSEQEIRTRLARLPASLSYVSLTTTPFTPFPAPNTVPWTNINTVGGLWYFQPAQNLNLYPQEVALLDTFTKNDLRRTGLVVVDRNKYTPRKKGPVTMPEDFLAYFLNQQDMEAMRGCFLPLIKVPGYEVLMNGCVLLPLSTPPAPDTGGAP
jgi:hypothetical protein